MESRGLGTSDCVRVWNRGQGYDILTTFFIWSSKKKMRLFMPEAIWCGSKTPHVDTIRVIKPPSPATSRSKELQFLRKNQRKKQPWCFPGCMAFER